jgi:hypothetical protein
MKNHPEIGEGEKMTPEREAKHVQRALRTIPLDAIAPDIAVHESQGDGLWCLVAGEVSFVPTDCGRTITCWDWGLAYAQYVRWLAAHPERIHETHESAVAFVRSRLVAKKGNRPEIAAKDEQEQDEE